MIEKKTNPKRSWIKALLVVSLGLNLAVVGLVIGAKLSGHGDKRAHFAGATGLRMFMHALPDDQRSEVRRYFRVHRTQVHVNGDAMREAMETIHVAIIARPFNPDALYTAFAAQRVHITTSTRDAQKAFVEIISQMTDAQRTVYVNTMKEKRRQWRKDHPRKQKP